MTTGLTFANNFITQKIDKNMVDSVANAIFERAASKSSQAVGNSVNNNVYNTDAYKNTVQNDVMTEARNSLTKAVNPFAEGIFNSQATQASASTNVTEAQAGVATNKGVAKQVTTKSKVVNSMALQNSMFTSAMRESMMVQAKEQMTQNMDLMSRLQFLNTKSAISTYPSKNFA